ncbi:hypothetical protein [Hymenobacter sp. BT559]|uniref:hypothetical protein n=1 Tax=Hymenobacter sp. BT559 TaxID=2795729 RepID=UPI0018EAEA70|nr:hypothetical protein [Hymenobacter sp. BT559]MBJ6145793.1 hypothetical protein [Hymenobacter sp. BT559]
MRFSTLLASVCLITASWQARAQTKDEVKAKIASSVCDCLQKKETEKPLNTLSKEQATTVVTTCFAAGAGKELAGIQHAYGASAFNQPELMKQIGREVGGLMLQNCPAFIRVSMALAQIDNASSAASTTGQTIGRLGTLHGTGIAMLDIDISDTEQTQFAWLQHLQSGDDLLAQLPKLKGQAVRVLWREVEVLDPSTNSYRKVRQLTGLEKQ